MPKSNIDVGRNGDCGFESIAARLIDLHRMNKSKGIVFDDLLNIYRTYFPKHLFAFSNEEAFNHLIETISPRQLIKNIAFALRQYAVNKMVAHPENYPGAFVDEAEGTSPALMRQPGTWIDGSALAAIAQGLKISIIIHCGDIDIPLYDKNKPFSCKEKISLTLSKGHYQPFVSDPSYFSKGMSPVSNNFPEVESHDPTLEEINKKIKLLKSMDRKRKIHAKHILETLDIEDLIAIYQNNLPHSDYLPNRIAVVTGQYEGDLFFVKAINDNIIDPARERALYKELVHALSIQAYIDKDFYEQELLRLYDENLLISYSR